MGTVPSARRSKLGKRRIRIVNEKMLCRSGNCLKIEIYRVSINYAVSACLQNLELIFLSPSSTCVSPFAMADRTITSSASTEQPHVSHLSVSSRTWGHDCTFLFCLGDEVVEGASHSKVVSLSSNKCLCLRFLLPTSSFHPAQTAQT